jgi:hypothetical protein
MPSPSLSEKSDGNVASPVGYPYTSSHRSFTPSQSTSDGGRDGKVVELLLLELLLEDELTTRVLELLLLLEDTILLLELLLTILLDEELELVEELLLEDSGTFRMSSPVTHASK